MQPSLAVNDRGTAAFSTDHRCAELKEFRDDGLFAERTGAGEATTRRQPDLSAAMCQPLARRCSKAACRE